MSRTSIRNTRTSAASLATSPVPGEEQPGLLQQFQHLCQISLGFMGQALPLAIGCGLLGLIVGDKVGLALGAGSFVMILSWRHPQGALWCFFLYMPFAGTVTYWLAGGNSLFQLAKDAFYVPALLSIFIAISRTKKQNFFKPQSILPSLWLLISFCILSLIFVNIPRQFSEGGALLAQGVLGMKVLVGYVPLIFLLQIIIPRQRELWLFNRIHVLLAIVCSLLCLVQYLFLSTGRCAGTDHLSGEALFSATLEAKCLVGGSLVYSPSQGVIRLPGTFVAPWQWGWFLIGNAYITFAAAFADPSWRWRLVGFLGMGCVTMGAVICGQRIALALVPVSFVLLLVLTGQLVNLKRLIPIIIASIVVGLWAWFQYQSLILERIASFQGRWEASPADAMIAFQFSFVWRSLKGEELLLGHGLGTATNSARMFGKTTLIETWFPKLLFEIGLLGTFIFIIFVTVLSIFTFIQYRRLQDRNLRTLGACYWVFVLFISYQTYYYPLDVDPVAVYYWTMVGVLFRLTDLDRQLMDAEKTTERSPQEKTIKPRFAPMRPPSLGVRD
jgi:hypothetical protein